MRGMLIALMWLAAGVVAAAETEHQRGDFRFSVGPVPAFVVRNEVPETWDGTAPGATGAHWRTWLHDVQSDRRESRDQVYSDYAFEPKATSVLGEAGRFQVGFNPGYQRLTIHTVEVRRSGVWADRLEPDRISLARRESGFEQDLADGIVTALIVLDDVRVDDVVRVSYTISGSNPVLEGQTADWMRFGWRNPILDSRMRVLHDAATDVRVYREHLATEPSIRRGTDGVEVTLHSRGIAPIVDESDYPLWYQPYPSAQVALDRNWSNVVVWALPLYPPAQSLPQDLEARLDEWSRLSDPHQRLKAALRAVQDEVRYFGVEMGENTHRPAAPETTWQRRYGDCKDKSYLLATLLGRMGIRAMPALVSTERGRAIADFVPSASVFNHVVVRAEIGKDVIWVDPTIAQEGGEPRDSDLSSYGMALPIARGVTRLEAIARPARHEAGIRSKEHYSPELDGRQIKLRIETEYRGRSANSARRSLSSERRDETSRRYADYYRKRFGEISVIDMPAVQDDRDGNVLKVAETYLLKAALQSEGTAVKALDVFAEVLDGPSALPPSMARTGPLATRYIGDYRQEIEITLPKTWTPKFGKESQALKSPAFAYSRDINVDVRNVSVVYRLDVSKDDIAPEQVPAHVDELRKLRDSLSARLRFQISSSLAGEERGKRLEALLKGVMSGEGTP
jgi:hypothetical protein